MVNGFCRHVLLCVQLTYIYFTIHACVTRVTITWPVVTPMCHTTTIATLVRLTWFNNLTTSSTETWILHTHKINLHTRTSSWLISLLVHGNIEQTLVNPLQGLLNCEIGGLDCLVITTVYTSCLLNIHGTTNVIHWSM